MNERGEHDASDVAMTRKEKPHIEDCVLEVRSVFTLKYSKDLKFDSIAYASHNCPWGSKLPSIQFSRTFNLMLPGLEVKLYVRASAATYPKGQRATTQLIWKPRGHHVRTECMDRA